MIYMDNAATSGKKPEAVYDTVLQAMRESGNADRGANRAALAASRRLFETRQKLAELFGVPSADASRIAFTSNATEALNIALRGLLHKGDRVITTVLEHNSVLRPLYELEEQGVEVVITGCDGLGRPLYEEVEAAITPGTKAIVCTHGSNLTGNVVDVARIGAIAHRRGVLLVVDASQTAGVIPIDVEQMQIDILCFTGHKGLMGPQGTGGIYVRDGLTITPLKTGGSGIHTFDRKHPAEMPVALEAGTMNIPGIAGLGAAVDFINQIGSDTIRKRETELMRRFYEGICNEHDIRIYGDFVAEMRCPVVAINFGNFPSSKMSVILEEEFEIAVRSGGHCAPLMHKALGTETQGAVRFSFSYFNTEEEVDAAIQAVQRICREIG